MSTIDEILANMPDDNVSATIDDVLVIDTNTRQITLPSSEFVFGVESDTHSERKYFMCSRYAGNQLDLASCFIRVNYRNANGETDTYLVDDVRVVGDNILFSWLLSKKVTIYRGQVQFVVCASRLRGNGSASVEWHTTVAKGTVLEGVEPDIDGIIAETDDALATLLATVDAQRENVIKEGVTQVAVVQAAAKAAENASVDEIEAKGANTLASIPDDYTALGVAVNAIDRGTAPGIVCEVEGSSVFVSDASNKPVQNICIFGKSIQDGVPSPENPVEIVSVENPSVYVCGVNLIDANSFELSLNTSLEISDDGYTITATGGSTSGWCSSIYTLPLDLVMLLRGKRVYTTCDLFTSKQEGVGVRAGFNVKLADGTTVYPASVGIEKQSISETIPETAVSIVFGIYTNNTGANLETDNTVIVKGLRVSLLDGMEWDKYKAIQKTTLPRTLPGIPVTSGGNYTDENGQQWVCDEVDLARGVYVQRVAHRPILSSDNWAELSAEGRYWLIEDAFYNVNASAYCTHFARATSWLNHTLDDGSFIVHRDPSWKDGRLSFKTNSITSLAAWKQFLDDNSVYVVYELATPVETPLSETELAAWRTMHTNKPNTTVLNDAGAHMAVAYTADTKLYIDNKIAALMSGK